MFDVQDSGVLSRIVALLMCCAFVDRQNRWIRPIHGRNRQAIADFLDSRKIRYTWRELRPRSTHHRTLSERIVYPSPPVV